MQRSLTVRSSRQTLRARGACQCPSMKPAHLPSDQLELLRYPVELEAGWLRSTRLPHRIRAAKSTYEELIEHGSGISGPRLRECRHVRVQQEYPPTQTSLVVRRRLPA